MDSSRKHAPLVRENAPSIRRSTSGSDSQASGGHISQLTSRMRSLAMTKNEIPKLARPGYGSRGSAVSLRSNLFAVNFPDNVTLYDYRIVVHPDPNPEEADLRKHVVALFLKSRELAAYGRDFASDGAGRLISKGKFTKELAVAVNAETGPRSNEMAYQVTLSKPKELKFSDLTAYIHGSKKDNYDAIPILSAFNLILKAHAARTGVRGSNKNAYFFDPQTDSGVRMRAGLTAVNGLYATARPVYNSLMVNVNSCMSAFYVPRERLSDSMLEFLRQSKGAMHPQKFFGRMRITTTHQGYRRRDTVKGFGSLSARKTVIESTEFGPVSLEKYFQKQFAITLKHADDLPVVIVGNGGKEVRLPAEVCKIEPGTLFSGVLTPSENAALCQANCKSPRADERTLTMKGLHLLGFDGNTAPMSNLGIKVSLDMAVISARLLPAPKVIYHSGQLSVTNGSWSSRDIRFSKPAQLTRFAVLVLVDGEGSRSEAELRQAVNALLAKCRSCGMQVNTEYVLQSVKLERPEADDPFRARALGDVLSTVKQLPGKPDMVLTLLSNRDPHIHAGMRTMFDVLIGCQSLCALTSSLLDKEGQDQYLTNLALKVNAKLGGVNHTIEPSSLKWLQNTMLVGMDVTHPGFGCVPGTPSIAAVVASCDMDFTQYPASVYLQGHKTVTIENVGNMMIERLKEYMRHMKTFPERIVIFRSGVSDEFALSSMDEEIKEIKKALRNLADCKPKMTYVTCVKGNHTRFYPMRPQDADATSNAKAGTVVDKGITSIKDFDFYLQAHSGSQGMARATRYTLIYDDNKYSPDVLQQGINDISYLWARATKSVSVVPPAYWADRACARARSYIHKFMDTVEGSKESKAPKEEIVSRAQATWGNGVAEDLKGTMYYM